MTNGLTGFQLKLIAILAMLIDHIAWAFVPLGSGWGQVMHFIGRITAPTMCFFIAQGYRHTRSLPRYVTRLAVFALISQLPFAYYNTARAGLFPLNMIYTLTMGLLAIYFFDTIHDESKRWMAVILIMFLSLPADWSMIGVAFCLAFYALEEDQTRLTAIIVAMAVMLVSLQTLVEMTEGRTFVEAFSRSWFHSGIIVSLFLLRRYNGQRGGGSWGRWLFYAFYPLHLVVLALLRWRF